MGPEITAGLPASLTAIGLYTAAISVIGLACCSFVSIYERRLVKDSGATPEAARITPTLPVSSLRQVEAKGLRDDFLSRN